MNRTPHMMHHRMKMLVQILLVAFVLGLTLPVMAVEHADRVAINGKFYTVNAEQPWAEAVAVKDTDIVYVGDNEGAKKLIGPDTIVGDLQGRLVLPGLVSGHEHPLVTAAFAAALQLEYSEDKDKMLKAVADYIKERPDAARMSWGGSYEGRVEIYRADIDKITTEPFVMIAASGHGAWINSSALEALGVTKGKKMPVDGFEYKEDGTPTGYLSTSAAAMYAVIQLELIQKDALLENLPEVIAMYNSYGFTAVYDAGTPPGAEPVIFDAVSEIEKQGKLNLRISASVIAQRPIHLERAFEILEEVTPKYTSEIFTVRTLKMHGGALDGYSAPLLQPYSDRPDYSGPVIFPVEVRNEASIKAAKLGYDIHTHVIGDRAIREALDSFEAIRKAGLDDVRLTTGHSSMVHPEDEARYKEYNVTLNTYATKNSVPDETNELRIGPERLKYWHANRSLINKGVRLAMSADSPTAPLDPFLQIEVSVLRKEPEQDSALHPEQGLTLEEAIYAYTMGPAYQIRGNKLFGSIEVGKRADLVVLSQNLFEVKPEQYHDTQAILTMLNGRIVHEASIDWDSPIEDFRFDACGTGGLDHDHKK